LDLVESEFEVILIIMIISNDMVLEMPRHRTGTLQLVRIIKERSERRDMFPGEF